jgi:D-alanyl-D-alanine carboxypeptidase/D-alanyl-D-alanine-endopeptidase (penicillin-binding protein 4)
VQQEEVFRFLRESPAKVFLVDEHIDDEVYGPGWAWDDYVYGFMPERSLFPLYGNRVRFKRAGDSLEVVPGFFSEYASDLRDSENNGGKRNKVREPFSNRFSVKGLAEGKEREIPFITSNQLVADLLGEAIGKKVTLVSGVDDEEFSELRTVPYDSLYAKMMIDSDNFIAEQLMLRVGQVNDSVYRVKSAIEHSLEVLLPDIPQKPRWVDGSGLSRYNLFTPESMVYILKKIHSAVPPDKMLGYFAAGGASGTLKDNYAGPGGQPYVFAKSGTLSNNYCLSGFLRTKKGKLLAFSFMDNHYQGSSQSRKREFQKMLERLRDAY